jgi:hypothetical protein
LNCGAIISHYQARKCSRNAANKAGEIGTPFPSQYFSRID